MAVAQVKAPALLVRKEGLDAEPSPVPDVGVMQEVRASCRKSRFVTSNSGSFWPASQTAPTSTGPKPCAVNSRSGSSMQSPGVRPRSHGEKVSPGQSASASKAFLAVRQT